MKIIVGAVVSLSPFSPGMVWHWLHYLIGFEKLGHEVLFVEEGDPEWCVDEQGRQVGLEKSANRFVFREIIERFGVMERACQFFNGGEAISGLSLQSLIAFAKEADLLVNVSGHVKADLLLSNVKRRLYLDQDPVHTQLWCAEQGVDLNFKMHDIFVSVALNIGPSHTPIPDCGIEWNHTLPPVLLDYWPFAPDRSCNVSPQSPHCARSASSGTEVISTGTNTRSSSGSLVCPKAVDQEFEVAVKYHGEEEAGLRLLGEGGWFFSDARQITDLESSLSDEVQSCRF